MNKLLDYIINSFKAYAAGLVGSYPDPAEPTDIGQALTQDDIDFVKRLRKEVEERYTENNA